MEHLNYHNSGFGPVLAEFMHRLFIKLASPEVAPVEPITKPDIKPKPITKPDENPWVWPFPSVEPTPKAFV